MQAPTYAAPGKDAGLWLTSWKLDPDVGVVSQLIEPPAGSTHIGVGIGYFTSGGGDLDDFEDITAGDSLVHVSEAGDTDDPGVTLQINGDDGPTTSSNAAPAVTGTVLHWGDDAICVDLEYTSERGIALSGVVSVPRRWPGPTLVHRGSGAYRSAMPDAIIDESNEAPAFQALNLSVVPVWLAMIVFPRSRLTARIVRASDGILAGLAAAYAAQLTMLAVTSGERPDFSDVAKLRQGMARPDGFLVGWTHFLAFDLFVGRWIWQTSVREGRSARLALLLTFMAGPAGLGVFALQRRSLRP